MLHIVIYTPVPKNPNTVPTKTKGESSVKNSALFYWWQMRDTVAQSTCCTWAPILQTLCFYFYRQPKLNFMLACLHILATFWQTNFRAIFGSPCLCQTSVRGQCYKDGWGRSFCWNRSWAPGLCPSQKKSCGLFEEGALIFHPPGIPGDHPGAYAKCGQAANPDSGCPWRAALAKLKKWSALLRVQHLHTFTCYLRQVPNFPSKLLSVWSLRYWWWEVIYITSRYIAYPLVQVPSCCQEQKATCVTCGELPTSPWWEEKLCCEI